jgi:hypothetical protein
MRLGKYEKGMLDFLGHFRVSEIHSIAKDRTTQRAAISLARKGLLKLGRFGDETHGRYDYIQRIHPFQHRIPRALYEASVLASTKAYSLGVAFTSFLAFHTWPNGDVMIDTRIAITFEPVAQQWRFSTVRQLASWDQVIIEFSTVMD